MNTIILVLVMSGLQAYVEAFLRRYVLDLRGNGGGLLGCGLKLSEDLLPKVVSSHACLDAQGIKSIWKIQTLLPLMDVQNTIIVKSR